MKYLRTLPILLLILIFGVAVAFAADGLDDRGNPNDPTFNQRANACFEGGSMDGKCLTEWDWDCGWYAIRFEENQLSRDEFPDECAVLLPSLPPVVVPNLATNTVPNIVSPPVVIPQTCNVTQTITGTSVSWNAVATWNPVPGQANIQSRIIIGAGGSSSSGSIPASLSTATITGGTGVGNLALYGGASFDIQDINGNTLLLITCM